ncbi:MAG: competence/damage-inducible protein A [Eubacteriales bacterium]|nr:competence/damage-inducible protein A [Eubacteriales bacterium]
MRVELLAVGTELLLGDILNTNSQYLAKKMAESGLNLHFQTVVGDNEARILESLENAFKRCDMVITTGGLGPTDDDITKETCAKFFNKNLILDQYSLDKIQTIFSQRNIKMPEINKKQAYYIEDSKILENNFGSAIGCYLETDGKHLIILPGPPSEMIPMFEEQVAPYLKSMQNETFYSNYINIFGIGESSVNEVFKDLLSLSNPTLAPYAKDSYVKLRITAAASSENVAQVEINKLKKEVYSRLGDYIFSEGNQSLEEILQEKLEKHKYTISTAESCSGGLLSAKLVNLPGISNTFIEGIVAYSNSAKVRTLGIPEDVILKYGAVSKETALYMARNVALINNTDVGISTTGIAGPGNDSTGKPVGLVYIGLYIRGKEYSQELNLFGNRNKIREMTTLYALDYLRKKL